MSMKPIMVLVCRLAAVCVLLAGGGVVAGEKVSPVARDFLLLDPGWAGRVVFYQRFEHGEAVPEIDEIDGQLWVDNAKITDGLAGRGLATASGNEKPTRLVEIRSSALSVHEPITVMMWWRLDAPMVETTSFALLHIYKSNAQRFIRTFVHGKGKWANLRRPTSIHQVWGFPAMANWSKPWHGRNVWFKPGTWHHVAISVSGGRTVDVYWDGGQYESIQVQGRTFREGDTDSVIFGPQISGGVHPMTIDELIVVDRALRASEIAVYVHDVRKLLEHPLVNAD
ncbi:MAG: LamG domain-containing protein [Candidatus Pacebacteria bacterium]|nr:LamG domain-containing protein [Candidatus Paceibacterota bacterium]